MGTYLGDKKAEIKKWADIARARRVGNCEVQSSFAFDWLARLNGRPKLELMSLYAGGNHPPQIQAAVTGSMEDFEGPDQVFVVVGRVAGDIAQYVTWNHDAVICDPWAKRAYFVTEFADEMNLIKRVSGNVTRTVQSFELGANEVW